MNPHLKKIRFFLVVALAVSLCSAAAYAQTTAGNNTTMTPTSCSPTPDYTDPTTYPNTYAGLYKNAEGIFSNVQFPELSPGDLQTTQNNLPLAPNLTPCPAAPWKDPVLTYAAYMFCSLNAPKPRNPLYDVPGVLSNGAATPPTAPINLTGAQLYAFEDYEQISAAATLVYGHCMRMVQRRLSYSHSYKMPPSNVLDPVTQCDQYDLNCQQTSVCHVLKGSMNGAVSAANNTYTEQTTNGSTSATGTGMPAGPQGSGSDPSASGTPTGGGGDSGTSGDSGASGDSGTSGGGDSGGSGAPPLPGLPATSNPNFGQNITNTNNPHYDGILASCDDTSDTYSGGLSEEAHDAIWAHRCDDPNHGGAHNANHGGGAQGEDAMTLCHAEAKAYDDGVRDDITKLEGEILALRALTDKLNSQKVK